MNGDSSRVVFEWLRSQPLVLTLFVFMVADILTGVAAAFITKTLSSDISYKGMTRKIVIWIVVAMSGFVGWVYPAIPLLQLAAGCYCAMELLSVLENAKRCGVPIPDVLSSALVRVTDPKAGQVTTTAVASVTTTTVAPSAEAAVIAEPVAAQIEEVK